MKKRVAGILLGCIITACLLTGCGEKSATEVANESAQTENAGNGNGEEDNSSEAVKNEENQEEEKEYTPIGVLLKEKESRDGVWKGSFFTSGLEEKDCQAFVSYADSDSKKQLEQLQEQLDQGIKIFIIDPVDPYAFSEALEEAKTSTDAKVKFISFDNLVMNTDQLSYYVTFDRRAIGWQSAERIIKDFSLEKMEDDADPVTIEFFMGSLDDTNALFFYNGMLEKLKPYFESGKLISRSGKTSFQDVGILREDTYTVRERLTKILAEFYADDIPDILVSGFDGAIYEIQNLLEEKEIIPGSEEWPYLTGFGSESEAVRDIAEGRVQFSMFMDCRNLVQKCVNLVDICVRGESPEVDNYEMYDNGIKIIGANTCDGQLIDKDNYQLLIDNGYYEADQVEPLEMVDSLFAEISIYPEAEDMNAAETEEAEEQLETEVDQQNITPTPAVEMKR